MTTMRYSAFLAGWNAAQSEQHITVFEALQIYLKSVDLPHDPYEKLTGVAKSAMLRIHLAEQRKEAAKVHTATINGLIGYGLITVNERGTIRLTEAGKAYMADRT